MKVGKLFFNKINCGNALFSVRALNFVAKAILVVEI